MDASLLRSLVLGLDLVRSLTSINSAVQTVPIVIFNTTSRALFDTSDTSRDHYAVFDDIVLLLDGGAQSAYYAQFACDGQPLSATSSSMSRAVTAALFESLWGVGAPYLTWSALHNAPMPDYVFGTGHSPFGPFSNHFSYEIAAFLVDSIVRNAVFAYFEGQKRAVEHSVELIRPFGVSGDVHVAIVKRMHVMSEKMERALESVGRREMSHAMFYSRLAQHDAKYEIMLKMNGKCGKMKENVSFWCILMSFWYFLVHFGTFWYFLCSSLLTLFVSF